MEPSLLRLRCGTNSYAWGKIGFDSAVARFAAATPHESLQIDSETPYSELWMGDHPSNPSYDIATGRTLQEIIQADPRILGAAVQGKFGKLPFLFKVLSVRNALSIQAHPNKALAALLHEANPTEYRDDNHKPEMTIAITPFEGLSGFRPLSEIAYFLGHISALRSLVGKAVAAELEQVSVRIEASLDEQRLALKNTFTVLVRASVGDVRAASERLLEQISEEGQLFAGGFRTPGPGGEALGGLVVRLNSQFPADVGLFMVFFLNFVELQPGEAMFLKADEVHAYISGGNILLYQSCVVGPEANSMPDIVECMASSDNVVRAGLTQKYKDADTLCQMLTYDFAPASEQKMHPASYTHCTFNEQSTDSCSSCKLYDPPIEEFSVLKTVLEESGASVAYDPFRGPTIIICTQGEGTIEAGAIKKEIKAGWVYFVGAETGYVLRNAGTVVMVAYQAFCDL